MLTSVSNVAFAVSVQTRICQEGLMSKYLTHFYSLHQFDKCSLFKESIPDIVK